MRNTLLTLLACIVYSTFTFAQNEAAQVISVQNDIQNYFSNAGGKAVNLSGLSTFSSKEETAGSRFLYNRWMDGAIITKDSVQLQTKGYQFNYDKVMKKFIATYNNLFIELEDSNFISVKLYADISYSPSLFERIPQLNNKLLIRITEGKGKYTLYKSISTKFRKADFQTNGLISSGKNYDEYVDTYEYYLMDNTKKTTSKISISYKGLKEGFKDDWQKYKKYDAEHYNAELNEAYLADLVTYINS